MDGAATLKIANRSFSIEHVENIDCGYSARCARACLCLTKTRLSREKSERVLWASITQLLVAARPSRLKRKVQEVTPPPIVAWNVTSYARITAKPA